MREDHASRAKPPQSHINATSKPPQGLLLANWLRPQSHHKASIKPPQCDPNAPTRRLQSAHKATSKPARAKADGRPPAAVRLRRTGRQNANRPATQLLKPNRCWMPGSLTGHSPDTRRCLTVDNFHTPRGAASRRRASKYDSGFRPTGGRQLSGVRATRERRYATVGTQRRDRRSGATPAVSGSLMPPGGRGAGKRIGLYLCRGGLIKWPQDEDPTGRTSPRDQRNPHRG